MRRRDRLGRLEIPLWSGLGVGAGLVAGFALSEWVGGVSRSRVRRSRPPAARRRARPAHHLGHRPGRSRRRSRPSRGWPACGSRCWPWRAAWSSCAAGCRPAPRGPSPAGPRSPRRASRASSTASSCAARTTSARPRTRGPPTRAHDRAARPPVRSVRHRVRPLRLVAGARACSRPTPAPAAPATPYVIMMPPPNVTAVLHMGHGLNNTVQDVLVRFERMRGRRAALAAGHRPRRHRHPERGRAAPGQGGPDPLRRRPRGVRRAGLGLRARDRRRHPRAAQGHRLLAPTGRRTYFTLDDGLSPRGARGVRPLYEKGLIYRGHYIINWCPRCLTALSNEEAEKEETDGKIWHLRYPLADGSGHVTVATTRPETMLGDTAWRCTPTTSATGTWSGSELLLPAGRPADPDRGRRRGRPGLRHRAP